MYYILLNHNKLAEAGIDMTPRTVVYSNRPVFRVDGLDVEIHEFGYRISVEGSMKGAELPRQINPDWVDNISFYEFITAAPHRAKGIYRLRTAEIRVDDAAGASRGASLHLIITCKVLPDAKELYEAIRAGVVTPVVTWENQQIQSPIRSIADLLRQAWQILRFEINKRTAQL